MASGLMLVATAFGKLHLLDSHLGEACWEEPPWYSTRAVKACLLEEAFNSWCSTRPGLLLCWLLHFLDIA